ncbi:unnamed protein product [Rodentolepis nana]|uniref:TMhelix containing protein n=1 Tax=Rodentolepis nana TaxID=102285 RepID=A0A0R3TNK0_RODNA|nr:unnamed protein product [Rodentolepis nana]
MNRLKILATVFTVLAACSATSAMLYFYIDTPTGSSNIWCQVIATFASGFGSGIMLCLLGTLCEYRL